MDRRTFVATSTATAAAFLMPEPVWAMDPLTADTVLRNALVFDGHGGPPVEVDVALSGDRISGVGRNLRASGAREVDLRGMALAPGFVDIHSHTDLVLLVEPKAESKLRQGVTTEVVGQDGSSIGPWSEEEAAERARSFRSQYGIDLGFRDLAGFFSAVESRGAALNLASMVGQGTLRAYVVGRDDRPATETEIARMRELAREALAAGACGISSGLEYTPSGFADTTELAALSEVLSGTGLPYASHMRNEDDRLMAAVEEAVMVGRRSGAAVQISHLKAQGGRNWWKTDPVLRTIAEAREAGVDVKFDVYPYIAYSTGLANLFPVSARDGGTRAFLDRLRDDDTRARLEVGVRDKIDQLGSWDAVQITSTGSEELSWAAGRRLGELATERGEDPFDLLVRLIVEDENRTRMVGFGMSEENVAAKIAHPLAIVCSDGGARAIEGPLSAGTPHPRTYGAFPRLLGHFVRDLGALPLEEAIRKITSAPADRVGLRERGRIEPGAFADLVAFDPDRVIDRATFEEPHQYPEGIPHIWVNGEQVLRDGEQTGALPGRVVRPG
jgi:N-acyl-D-amino-acid deacylase